MDRLSRNRVLLFVIVMLLVVLLSIVAVGGQITTYFKVRDQTELVAKIDANAARAECARKINADIDQARWDAISALVGAANDPEAMQVGRDRLTHLPNSADQIDRECPPPL